MKKLVGVLGLAGCALAAVSVPAQARDAVQFYLGGDYQYVKPDWKSSVTAVLPKSLASGMDAHLGVRWMGYYAAELGYMSSDASRNVYGPAVGGVRGPLLANTKVTISGPTFDLYGYLPFGNSPFAGFATVGGSYLSGHADIDAGTFGVTKAHKTEGGYRGGLGIEWRPQPRFGMRIMARYQSADFDGVAKDAIIGSIGFNFYL